MEVKNRSKQLCYTITSDSIYGTPESRDPIYGILGSSDPIATFTIFNGNIEYVNMQSQKTQFPRTEFTYRGKFKWARSPMRGEQVLAELTTSLISSKKPFVRILSGITLEMRDHIIATAIPLLKDLRWREKHVLVRSDPVREEFLLDARCHG